MSKTLVSLAVIAAPIAAQSALSTPESPCFADGTATYRLAPAAGLPDIRVRFDNTAARPDLRMQLVDRPEIADFVLVDDTGGRPSTACRSSVPIKTVKVDATATSPDVTVALAADISAPHYRVYVHSLRFSHQDAAAFLAAMWKVAQRRERTATAGLTP